MAGRRDHRCEDGADRTRRVRDVEVRRVFGGRTVRVRPQQPWRRVPALVALRYCDRIVEAVDRGRTSRSRVSRCHPMAGRWHSCTTAWLAAVSSCAMRTRSRCGRRRSCRRGSSSTFPNGGRAAPRSHSRSGRLMSSATSTRSTSAAVAPIAGPKAKPARSISTLCRNRKSSIGKASMGLPWRACCTARRIASRGRVR